MFSEKLVEILRSDPKTTRVVVSTGAGISAESGVPTFRGDDGLWKKFRPEELATVDAFMRNPEMVWEWYQYRRNLMNSIEPNPGHYALAEMERHFDNFWLITQNIDGLHYRAGSRNIYELHGNIRRNKCMDCGRRYDEVSFTPEGGIPLCECGGKIRPDVVWFGEMLPADVLDTAFRVSRSCDLFLSVGTSGVVQPAASLPLAAVESGAFVVEINPESTPLTGYVSECIQGKSGEILPEMVKVLGS